MGRKKIYMCEQIPKSVRQLVTLFCADYWRRSKYIKDDRSKPEIVEKYKEINEKIDKCLEFADCGIRGQMLIDIAHNTGWDRSPAFDMINRNSYFKQKSTVITNIAKALNLI
jgi:hypothetical protein